jgi:predicted aspartyl protease
VVESQPSKLLVGGSIPLSRSTPNAVRRPFRLPTVPVFALRIALVIALASAANCVSTRTSSGSTDLPVQLVNNLVFVPVRVGGSEPLSFILDTGASVTVVNRAVAERLKLDLAAGEDATTGGGSVATASVSGVTLSVGDVSLSDVTLVAIDLSGLHAGLGRPVDGILGYDIFQRYVVEIDYERGAVRLHEPAGYVYAGGGDSLPVVIEDRIPFAQLQLRGAGGRLATAKVELDTGQTGAVTLIAPFVAANDLVGAEQPRLRIRTGALLSGAVTAEVVRLPEVRLGRFQVADPIVNVTPGAEGAGVSGATAGLLGGEVLRRFKVIVDYSRSRVVLEPNAQLDAPMEFDMSGMSLAAVPADPSVYRVRALIEGSPATDAGVSVGDLLTGIDGTPVRAMTLDDIRRRFKVPGRRFALTLKRDAGVTELSLTTRRLI